MKSIIPVIIGLSLLVILVPSLVYAEHGDWFVREHCVNTNCTNFNPSNENKLRVEVVSTGGFDGVLKMSGGGGASAVATGGNLGMVFDKAELDGKLITWEYSRSSLNGIMPKIFLHDGELDPFKFGLAPSSCGTDCFQDENGVVTSGSASSILVIQGFAGNSDFTTKNSTGSANLSAFDSPTGKVTLVVNQPENSPAVFMGSHFFQITIEDIGTFRFKSDSNDPSWSGTTVTCITDSSKCATNSAGGSPEAREGVWSVTSRPPPDVIPPVISIPKGEPVIFYDGDSIFDSVNCSDDLEVVGHPIEEFGTDGGVTIDGEDHGLHTQDFTCTDEEGNETLITVDYLVKRLTSGGGAGGSDNTMLPPSSSESPSVKTGSERLLGLLSFLGENDITEGEVTFDSTASAPSSEPATTTQPVQNAIANFFSNLFSFFG